MPEELNDNITERAHIATAVQHMMAAILLARTAGRYHLTAGQEVRASFNITFVELAIDFEIYTGLHRPAAKRRAPGAVADRAQAFSDMLAKVSAHAAPNLIYGGAGVHPSAAGCQPHRGALSAPHPPGRGRHRSPR